MRIRLKAGTAVNDKAYFRSNANHEGELHTMATQHEKAETFRALHAADSTFVIPNPWDAGTAAVLAGLGFKALATTSSGLAFVHGRAGAVGWAHGLVATDLIDHLPAVLDDLLE